MTDTVEWAGLEFLPIHHHDGRMIRAPGLYGFVRREASGVRELLYVGEAECIAEAAHPGHKLWGAALEKGMNELCVCLTSAERLERQRLKANVEAGVGRPLTAALG